MSEFMLTACGSTYKDNRVGVWVTGSDTVSEIELVNVLGRDKGMPPRVVST